MIAIRLVPAAALALALTTAALPVRAAVFAEFSPISSAADFKWIRSGGAGDGGAFDSIVNSSSLVAQSAPVTFTFLDPSLSALVFLPAQFMFSASASGTPATTDGVSFTQTNINGGFSFTYSGPTTTIGAITLTQNVTNLLSGVFSNARIRGSGGSGAANLSNPPGSLSYASDVENVSLFLPGSSEFAFSLLARPGFNAQAGKALSTFTASGVGNFSAVAAPEPTSWLLMIAGFGAIGGALRLRRRMALA